MVNGRLQRHIMEFHAYQMQFHSSYKFRNLDAVQKRRGRFQKHLEFYLGIKLPSPQAFISSLFDNLASEI